MDMIRFEHSEAPRIQFPARGDTDQVGAQVRLYEIEIAQRRNVPVGTEGRLQLVTMRRRLQSVVSSQQCVVRSQ
jgi:hypothetical protein